MSYKLPAPPADTPITNAAEYASDPDQCGQICGLVGSSIARSIERERNEFRALAKRLLEELCNFDCDDTGQDLKDEARLLLELPR